VVYGLHVPEQPVSEPAADTPPPDVVTGSLTVPESAGPEAEGPEGGVPDPGLPVVAEADSGKFTVRLTNFTGPFDLLLQLIGKHKLDVTEIALHQVTDDFIAYIRAMGDDWDLGETSEFLLVAATLLDLKAARLLPSAEVEDEDDLALLEAGDLLFARLLQYKAYKEAAAVIADLEGIGARRWPRAVTLEPRYAEALPDLVLGFGPERLLKLALKQFLPKPPPPEVSIAHIHQVRVSVREHAALIRDRLRRAGSATFSLLIADCANTLEVVARFLALLELYREGLIDFEQPVSLEEMTVRWIGGDQAEGDLDIDDYEGTPAEPDTAALDPDDINLDDLESEPPPAEASAPDPDEDDDEDLDDLDVEDVDYAALADAALGSRREGADLDDEEAGEPVAEPDGEAAVPDPAGDDGGPARFDDAEAGAARPDPARPEADEPVAGADEPVAGADEPEAGADEPEVGKPEAGVDEPHAGAGEPEAGEPDAGVDEPEVGEPEVGEHVAGVGEPEADEAEVEAPIGVADVAEPDAFGQVVAEPDQAEPDTEREARDGSGAAGAGIPGSGHHTADRVANNEEQS
jgi:segregation and condensation protein A